MVARFPQSFTLSLALHGAILAMVFLRAVFFPSEPIDLQGAIRVDVVGLPPKMTEPQTLPPPEAAKPETVAPPAPPEPKPAPESKSQKPDAPKLDLNKSVNKKDLKKQQEQILAKMRAQQAIDNLKKESKNRAHTNTPAPIAGNEVSEGNKLEGTKRLEFDRYQGDLESQVRANWKLPQWLADAGLNAVVEILVDERGYIVKKTMIKSSGNEIFDNHVIAALDASSPLPPPPDRLRKILATSGARMSFP